jgi:hypothetical protein
MNDSYQRDEIDAAELDTLLNHGAPTPHRVINRLANTTPQPDAEFERALESQLMAQLSPQSATKEVKRMTARTRSLTAFSGLRPASLLWAAAAITIVIATVALLRPGLNGLPQTAGPAALHEAPITTPVIIAAQDIAAGEVITDEMLMQIHVPVSDLDALRASHPERVLFESTSNLIGQRVTTAIAWLQPITSTAVRAANATCRPGEPRCSTVPAGYQPISLPASATTARGLEAGDRVEVLAVLDNQLRLIADDILLVELQPETVTLAAPSWKHSILVWLSQSGGAYALRAHARPDVADTDRATATHRFVMPELPDGYSFHMVINLPVTKGYQLAEAPAPYAFNQLDYTENRGIMRFWLKTFEVVDITPADGGTAITLELPVDHDANLDYLIELGAEISFLPATN